MLYIQTCSEIEDSWPTFLKFVKIHEFLRFLKSLKSVNFFFVFAYLNERGFEL